jgi:hypothetical protein
MKLNYKKLSRRFDKILEKITPEELEKYCPKDTRPTGWISIEDDLPRCIGIDFVNQGYSIYKVLDKDGNEFFSRVCDHNIWYYGAKEQGITHWWHE